MQGLKEEDEKCIDDELWDTVPNRKYVNLFQNQVGGEGNQSLSGAVMGMLEKSMIHIPMVSIT